MKILIFSDSHNMGLLKIEEILAVNEDIDLVIFLGDVEEDAQRIREIFGIEVVSVIGNNDFLTLDGEDRLLELKGHTLYLTHGHRHRVSKDIMELVNYAKKQGADLALYGHTHVYDDRVIEGVRVLNPGSPSIPRSKDRLRTCMLMEMESDGKINIEKIIL